MSSMTEIFIYNKVAMWTSTSGGRRNVSFRAFLITHVFKLTITGIVLALCAGGNRG